MGEAMNIAALHRMIVGDAAFRRRQRLHPVGGKGDKIFSPTYPPSDEARSANGDLAPAPE
jgi:hypothetical protein